ncbi:MAG: PmbA/TldA family metallopeptidase, partial [Vulcanimicrobiaceae bacterium]
MHSHRREELAARVLAMVTSGDAEVFVSADESALTRFTRDTIHQNVAKHETSISLRILRDGQMGVARTNILSDEGLAACVAHASDLTTFSPP